MDDVYIIGIDMIPFQRNTDRTVQQLGGDAALLAALDRCARPHPLIDMQALYCGNLLQASASVGQRVMHEIGETGIPVVNTANACATGATAFREG